MIYECADLLSQSVFEVKGRIPNYGTVHTGHKIFWRFDTTGKGLEIK